MKKYYGKASIIICLLLIFGLDLVHSKSVTPQLKKETNQSKLEKEPISPTTTDSNPQEKIKKTINKPIANVIQFKGKVTISKKGVKLNQDIYKKSIIITDSDSFCVLNIVRKGIKGKIKINENSKFSFNNFELGDANFIVDKTKPTQSFEVRTSLASIGIRGTNFSVQVLKDKTNKISVYKGKIRIRPRIQELENLDDSFIEHSTGLSHLFLALINKSITLGSGNYATIKGSDYDNFIRQTGLVELFSIKDTDKKKVALENYFEEEKKSEEVRELLKNNLTIFTNKIGKEKESDKLSENVTLGQKSDSNKNEETLLETKEKKELDELNKDKDLIEKRTKLEEVTTVNNEEIATKNKNDQTNSNIDKPTEKNEPPHTEKNEQTIEELAENLKKIADKLNKEVDKSCKDINVTTEKSTGNIEISLAPKISFEKGSYTLKPDAKKVIDKILVAIKKYPKGKIFIEGHTDHHPVKADNQMGNWRLSVNRALSVLEYFLSNSKIDPSRFIVAGYSKYKPMKNKSTISRRVEIVIVPK